MGAEEDLWNVPGFWQRLQRKTSLLGDSESHSLQKPNTSSACGDSKGRGERREGEDGGGGREGEKGGGKGREREKRKGEEREGEGRRGRVRGGEGRRGRVRGGEGG